MNADQTVTAHFAAITTYDLTMVLDPVAGGTTNPAAGVHKYAEGTAVDITATPSAGYAFDHWSGACTGSSTCQVIMNANQTVTASFAEFPPTCYALALGHTGQGSDPVASPANSTGCSAGEYVAGETVNLSGAVPDKGWQISGWTCTDNDASTASTNSLTMPASNHAASVIYEVYIYIPIIINNVATR